MAKKGAYCPLLSMLFISSFMISAYSIKSLTGRDAKKFIPVPVTASDSLTYSVFRLLGVSPQTPGREKNLRLSLVLSAIHAQEAV